MTATALALDNGIDKTLDRFQEVRAGARRHQGELIGKDVDPDFCLGDWLVQVKDRNRKGLEKYYAKTAMAESPGGTLGGYLVPVELRDDLMRDISSGSLFRKLGATVVPMDSAELDLPLPDVSTAQAANTAPYFGGITMQWTEEGAPRPETAEPKFRTVRLKAWVLAGYALVSNPMMRDAVGIEAWLRKIFGWSIGWYESYAHFQGNGAGQPNGVIKSAASATRSRAVANQIAVADAQNMIDNLLPSSWERAVWFCHPTTLIQIIAFTGWFPNGPLMLYGRPLIPTGQCSTLGSRGDLVLADPGLYVIGDRQKIEIAHTREEPTAFTKNQSAWRVGFRADGQPWTAAPITLADGASQVSPYVVLV